MQISLNWLRDYISIQEDVREITNLLTFSGIEVEDSYQYGLIPESVVAAKITDCKKIEESDHLHVCQVDSGKEVWQIVCGAPNCRTGMIGALALPGTKLGDITIKKTMIRGVESSGMLCSEKELGLSDDHKGILVLPGDTIPGTKLTEILCLPDHIFELEITPNRPDLLGYHGIASDLASSSGSFVKKLNTDIDALLSGANSISCESLLSVNNHESDLCLRYVARVIQNVQIAESPLWLKMRLIKSGLRPINNIVDITNYVMLETGHPLHAFDYDKLSSIKGKPEIQIRRAGQNEAFPALDGNQYNLQEENLVIADSEKAIALAGVIGGTNSHITDSTENIVLEAACFNHSSIRKTAYQHKISTDSSYRFERQLAPETCEVANTLAAKMIVELAGGKPAAGSIDKWLNPVPPKVLPLRPSRIKQVIGIELDKEHIVEYLVKLGLTYLGEGCYKNYYPDAETSPRVVETKDRTKYFEIKDADKERYAKVLPVDEALYFEIPPKRVDLVREIDLVEEVIRVHGMDKIPQKLSAPLIMDRHAFRIKRSTADYLVGNGFQEIVNLSFTDPFHLKALYENREDILGETIALLNPQNSNLSVMRSSLIPQLLLTAQFNLSRQIKQLKIFELNKVFANSHGLPKLERVRLSLLVVGNANNLNWKQKSQQYGFFELKGLVTDLCNMLGLDNLHFSESMNTCLVKQESQTISCSSKVIADYGKLKPLIASKFNIDTIELKQDVWIADIDLAEIIEITREDKTNYLPVQKFPSTERDLSFQISSGIQHDLISRHIADICGEDLSELTLIDEYRGKQIPQGYRSLTYRFVFNNSEKTLTDEEVDDKIDLVIRGLKSQWEIQLR